MYAGTRPRHSATARSKDPRSSRNTAMPISASVMISSQLPLAPEPLISTGRYTVRSIVAKRAAPGHPPGYVYRISSAARDQPVPAHPVCSGALLLLCVLIVEDQASMIWIAFAAYRASRVTYQTSASARGWGVRDSEALPFALSSADFHGCAPACALARAKSSCARLTSTPGWTKPPAGRGAAAGRVCARATAPGTSSAPATATVNQMPLRRSIQNPLGGGVSLGE